MLPQELSTDICSLRANEDRLVLSCLMRIDPQGEILDYEVTEGVIRSARRMTYTQVHAIIEGDTEARAQFAPLVPEFERMMDLARILNRKRERRGSIDFDCPEPLIEFDEFGAMKSVTRAERNWAHRLIEEFMLSANECVASWLEISASRPSTASTRSPSPAASSIRKIAAAFGYSLGIGSLPVRTFRMRSERRERKTAEAAPLVATRFPAIFPSRRACIKASREDRRQARGTHSLLPHAPLAAPGPLQREDEGHFALAASCYTHFTSPIRRYPDLIVHRIAKELLHAGVSNHGVLAKGEPHSPVKRHEAEPHSHQHGAKRSSPDEQSPIAEGELAAIAQESSESERRAADAERELVDWKKIKFMRDRVGESFTGMILNATKYGLFVELDDLFVEGLVPIQTLGLFDNDHYTYRENTTRSLATAGAASFPWESACAWSSTASLRRNESCNSRLSKRDWS